MQRAGLAVAKLALSVAPQVRHWVVAVGPGNNGGDGLVAARLLQAAGVAVTAVCTKVDGLPPDATLAMAQAQAAGVNLSKEWPNTRGHLVIDALLGVGRRRDPEGGLAHVWAAMLGDPAPRLAVDVPSGLDADKGTWGNGKGLEVPRAAHTLSLLTLKPGLFTGAGRDVSGTIWFDALGCDTGRAPATAWLGTGNASHQCRSPAHQSHKGSRGDVVVVGGAEGMQGALLLAARAAAAAGSGRVFAVPLSNATLLTGTHASPASWGMGESPELMWRLAAMLNDRKVLSTSVVVCGCGAGNDVRAVLPNLLANATRLVLDADALNAVASDASLQNQLRTRAARGFTTVLTPHPLEAARLAGLPDARAIQQDRLHFAQQLAQQFLSVVVLKGAGTVVAWPDHVPTVNPTGNGLLATAGTGDVLAGWIGGRWARNGPAAADDTLGLAQLAASCAWVHGQAADNALSAGRSSRLTPTALMDAMANL